jgi:hypothetical protein
MSVAASCVKKIAVERWWALRTVAFSMISWGLLFFFINLYVDATAPADPVVVADWPGGAKYQLEPRVDGGYWLNIHFRIDQDERCFRDSSAAFVRFVPGKPPDTYVIGTGLKTEGPSAVGSDFTRRYFVPIGYPSGDWQFIFQAQYRCWPDGLVIHDKKIPPFTVTIP